MRVERIGPDPKIVQPPHPVVPIGEELPEPNQPTTEGDAHLPVTKGVNPLKPQPHDGEIDKLA